MRNKNKWLIGMMAFLCSIGISAETNASDNEMVWKLDATTVKAMEEKNKMDVVALNEALRANCPSIVDQMAIAEETDGQWVREQIALYQLPNDALYRRGKLIDEADRERALANRNLAPIGKTQPIGYGVAIRYANVKALPIEGGLFLSADQVTGDVLQQGKLAVCEAVRLLHVSQDRRYYFVQGETVKGWVFVGDIAVAKKSVWERYYDPGEYLVVTTRGIRVKQGRETIYVPMGARLPILSVGEKYKVRIPLRGSSGKVTEGEALIEKNDDVQIGYLSYEQANIEKLASLYINETSRQPKDMIGMTGAIYRAMGIVLPYDRTDYTKALSLLPAVGSCQLTQTVDGDPILVLEREDDTATVIGQMPDGKAIGQYSLATDRIGSETK